MLEVSYGILAQHMADLLDQKVDHNWSSAMCAGIKTNFIRRVPYEGRKYENISEYNVLLAYYPQALFNLNTFQLTIICRYLKKLNIINAKLPSFMIVMMWYRSNVFAEIIRG